MSDPAQEPSENDSGEQAAPPEAATPAADSETVAAETTAGETTTGEADAGESPEEPKDDPLIPFAATLKESLADHLREDVRATPNGVFINESLFDQVLKLYDAWLKENSGKSSGNPKKHTARLFGDEPPALYYLVEGKLCIAGYLLGCKLANEKILGLPFFRGSLHDARSFIHQRDPVLTNTENISGEVTKQGFRIKISTAQRSYSVTQEKLKNFIAVAGNSHPVTKRHPRVAGSLREALPALADLLSNAKPVKKRHSVLIPASIRRDRDKMFIVRLGSLYLVSDSQNEIVECYELRGKNFHQFIKDEFESLRRASRGGKLGDFEFNRSKTRAIGFVRAEGNRHPVLPEAFKEFLLLAPRTRSYEKNFKPRYTVRDAIDQFVTAYNASQRVEEYNVPRHLIQEHGTSPRYRQTSGWTFFLSDKNAILKSFPRHQIRGHQARGNNRQADKKGRSGKPRGPAKNKSTSANSSSKSNKH